MHQSSGAGCKDWRVGVKDESFSCPSTSLGRSCFRLCTAYERGTLPAEAPARTSAGVFGRPQPLPGMGGCGGKAQSPGGER